MVVVDFVAVLVPVNVVEVVAAAGAVEEAEDAVVAVVDRMAIRNVFRSLNLAASLRT